jgi:O-antigen/teichoic acid export membrane protein
MDDGPADFSGKVAKGSLWGFIGNFGSKLVSFIYVILLARAATQEDIGLFYLSFSIIGLVMVFSEFGLPFSLQRYVPYYEGRGENHKIAGIMRATYLITLISSVFFMAVIWAGADMFASVYQNPALALAMRLIVPFIIIGSMFKISVFFLQGRADIRAMQLVMNAQNLTKLVLTILLFYLIGPSLLSISVSFTLSHLIAIIISAPEMKKASKGIPISGAVSRGELLSEIIPFGLMLSLLTSFSAILGSADKIALGYLIDPAEAAAIVAVYSIASSLAFMLTLIPSSIESIFLPLMSRLVAKNDLPGMRSLTETAQRWSLLLTLPAAVALMIFSADVVGALYGDEYRAGALPMSILALAFAIRTYSHMLSVTLAAMRMVKLELLVYCISALLNIILNTILIPHYGMEGAAAATLISMAVMTLLFSHYAWKLFGYSFPAQVFRLSLAGLLTFLIILAVHGPLASLLPPVSSGTYASEYTAKLLYLGFFGILSVLIVAVFSILSIALRCLQEEDLALLERIMKKARIPRPAADIASKISAMGLERVK